MATQGATTSFLSNTQNKYMIIFCPILANEHMSL